MNLVVVESPSKAKTINKYLGSDYKVISSVGHIIDLPKSKLGVDVENNFEPQYETIVGKEKVIRQLKADAKKADKIILATDPDREGEAISWHISNVLKSVKKPQERIVFHEITKSAILEAMKHPRKIDTNLVDAQQARRVLDRLVGYTLSPLIWKKIRYGLSAGRVQSVALRLIVDRERERQAFKNEEYWTVQLKVESEKSKAGNAKILTILKDQEDKHKFEEGEFVLELKKINEKTAEIVSQKEFDEIAAILQSNSIKIIELKERQVKKHPNPAFTTSTFQQAAVNVLGMTSRNAMRSAQKLYEAGLITYMRTDSVNLSGQAVDEARKVVSKKYGKEYIPEKANFYKNASKSAQEAHEAIRPTSFEVREIPKNLTQYEQKVYDLIYRRALASQMTDARFTQKTIVAEVESNVMVSLSNHDSSKNQTLRQAQGDKSGKVKLTLTATAQKCDFDGWMKLYKVNENQALLKLIEEITVGSELNAGEIFGFQHFTEPPARYTEATLIKALEKYGIGRPSTYSSIVSVIMQRTYAEKDGRYFFPTDVGMVVSDMLKKHFENIVDVDFTARMETDLDNVAEGKMKWQPFVGEFFIPFQKRVKEKDKEIKKDDLVIVGPSDEKCDICGKPMIKKLGRFGTFLSCSDFPTCQGIKSLNPELETKLETPEQREEFFKKYKPSPKTDDGRDYLLKRGRFGEFWAHPDYPKVKDAQPLEMTDELIEATYGKAPKAKDGKKMILRKGKFGFFWAHPNYPEVKELQKAKIIKAEE